MMAQIIGIGLAGAGVIGGVIERRAGIMTVEFLGFVPAHVFMVRPELALSDEIEVDGEAVSVPRFQPGSWYVEDNPEFV